MRKLCAWLAIHGICGHGWWRGVLHLNRTRNHYTSHYPAATTHTHTCTCSPRKTNQALGACAHGRPNVTTNISYAAYFARCARCTRVCVGLDMVICNIVVLGAKRMRSSVPRLHIVCSRRWMHIVFFYFFIWQGCALLNGRMWILLVVQEVPNEFYGVGLAHEWSESGAIWWTKMKETQLDHQKRRLLQLGYQYIISKS